MSNDEIRSFWEREALRYGDSKAIHSDPYLSELETWFIVEKALKRFRPKSLLDVGCGNGQRTRTFSEYVSGGIVGIDYSKNMISSAKKLENGNLHFHVANIADKISLNAIDHPFDCVVSCRCLINLASTENQLNAMNNIFDLVSKDGLVVFCETFMQGTAKLNSMREKFDLKPVKVIAANLDLDETMFSAQLENQFDIIERSTLGTYYLLTRVYYPALIYPKEPNPRSKFNELAAQLTMEIGGDALGSWGRQLCIVARKRRTQTNPV